MLENGQAAWHHLLKLHFHMQKILKDVVSNGPTFEQDNWAEEELAAVLVRHECLCRDLSQLVFP